MSLPCELKGNIVPDSITVNFFEIYDSSKSGLGMMFEIECNIECEVEDLSIESAGSGGILYGFTPITILHMSIRDDYAHSVEDFELDDSIIEDILKNIKFDTTIYMQYPDGVSYDFSCSTENLTGNEYYNFFLDNIVATFGNDSNLGGITVLDDDIQIALTEYALEQNYSTQYLVIDEGMDYRTDALNAYEYSDDAINYAIANDAYQVICVTEWYDYEISPNGRIGVHNIDEDVSVEWTNPDYVD